MKKTLILLLLAGTVGLSTIALMADENEEQRETYEREHSEEHDHDDGRREHRNGLGAAYLSDPQYGLYKTECGDCHMTYPPSMLPASSWRTMMGNLEDHFGDNAELDAATANRITAFLTGNSASKERGEYGERTWRTTQGRTPPLRITQTDYFLGQHHEIPDRMGAGNPDVSSFSRCETCHRGADQGNFDEHGVRIPGYGRWDD